MFRRFSMKLPPGLDVDAFVEFLSKKFVTESLEAIALYKEKMQKLIESEFYYILAITAPMLGPEKEALHHYIIGAGTYCTCLKNCQEVLSILLASLTKVIPTIAP
jgi:hypothetical protein